MYFTYIKHIPSKTIIIFRHATIYVRFLKGGRKEERKKGETHSVKSYLCGRYLKYA